MKERTETDINKIKYQFFNKNISFENSQQFECKIFNILYTQFPSTIPPALNHHLNNCFFFILILSSKLSPLAKNEQPSE